LLQELFGDEPRVSGRDRVRDLGKGALWFITLIIGIYGMATGDLCLWRRGDN
jgi:hypothetical protein